MRRPEQVAAGTRSRASRGGGVVRLRAGPRLAVSPGRGAPDRPRLTQGRAEPGEWGQGAAPSRVTAPSRASAPPPFHSVAQHGWSAALSPPHRHRRRHRSSNSSSSLPGALGTVLRPGWQQACWASRTRALCAWLSGELREGGREESERRRAGGFPRSLTPGPCVATTLGTAVAAPHPPPHPRGPGAARCTIASRAAFG